MKLRKGDETATVAFRLSLETNIGEDRGISANGPLGAEHAAQKAKRARKLQRNARAHR